MQAVAFIRALKSNGALCSAPPKDGRSSNSISPAAKPGNDTAMARKARQCPALCLLTQSLTAQIAPPSSRA